MANVFQRILAQVNPFDKGATYANPAPPAAPQPPRVNAQQLQQALAQAHPSVLHNIIANAEHIAASPFVPMVKPIVANYDLARAGVGALTGNHQAAQNGLHAAGQDYHDAASAVQGFTRPIPQIATTMLHPTRQATYTPGSRVEKAIFGDTPVQNIQAGVASNYRQHPNLPTPARVGLAGLYGAGQVAQDLPYVAGAAKGVKIAAPKALEVGQKLDTAAENRGLPQAYRLTQEDKAALGGLSDHYAGEKVADLNNIYQHVHDLQKKTGQQFITGNPEYDRIAIGDYLEGRKGIAQGGFVGLTKKQVAETKSNIAVNKALGKKGSDLVTAPPTPPEVVPPISSEAKLPVYGSKKTRALDLATRSTRSIIERMGEHGQKLAGMLQGQRDAKELYLRQLEKSLPTVRKLKGKDFENFVESTQGRAAASSPKVEQAISEWQAVHPGIRDRAVAAGLDVGNLGNGYYPHFVNYEKVLKDKNAFNEAINHIVQTGQAKTPEDAIKLLSYAKDVSRNRRFGNLEASRLVDIPHYDKTPNSLASYLNSSADRITKTEIFGAKDEHALKLIAKAAKQGHDTEAMKNAYDVAVGAKNYNANMHAASNKIRSYMSTTRLGLGAITNSSQSVNTGIVTGHMRTLKSIMKQLDPKTREWAADTGVISDAVINDLKEGAGFSGKVLGKLTAPGFSAVEKFNRRVAATSGRDYALRLAQKGDEKTLRRLGVTGDIQAKTLTEAQQIQAARKVVEKTQFKVDPQDLPGWASSPGGKLVAQFRTFSYSQGKFFSNEVLKPMGKGNYAPLARLLAALPVGYGLYETKSKISGRPPEQNQVREGADVFGNVGGAGLALDIYRGMFPLGGKYIPPDRRIAMALGTFGGPTAGAAADLVSGASELTQKKNVPDKGIAGKVGIPAGSNNKGKAQYLDATSLARTGLRQLPIVGTPLANRLLPYRSNTSPTKVLPQAAAADASSTMIDPKAVALAGFTKDEQKFLNLSGKEQTAAIANNPNMKKVLASYNAAKGALQNRADITKSFPEGLSPENTDTLVQVARLAPQGRAKFMDNPQNKYAYELANLQKDTLNGTKTQDDIYPALRSALKYHLAPADVKTSQLDNYYKEPANAYTLAAAQYQLDKQNNRLSPLQDFEAKNSLTKLAAQKDFSKEAVDLYALSKGRLTSYIKQNNLPQTLQNELYKLDSATAQATGGSLKYKNGLTISSGPKVAYRAPRAVRGIGKIPRGPKVARIAKLKFRAPKTPTQKKIKLLA